MFQVFGVRPPCARGGGVGATLFWCLSCPVEVSGLALDSIWICDYNRVLFLLLNCFLFFFYLSDYVECLEG